MVVDGRTAKVLSTPQQAIRYHVKFYKVILCSLAYCHLPEEQALKRCHVGWVTTLPVKTKFWQ